MRTFDDILGKEDKTVAEILLIQAIATLSTQPAFSSMTPEDVFNTIVGYAFPVPEVLFFWDNGLTMAGDIRGRQMPRYHGTHREALDKLATDGIALERVRNIYGSPENPVAWVRPGVEGEIPKQFRGEQGPWTTVDLNTEFAVTRARLAGVCRICGEPISGAGSPAGWEHEFGERIYPDAVTLNFGAEFSHTACLPPRPDPEPDRTINESEHDAGKGGG